MMSTVWAETYSPLLHILAIALISHLACSQHTHTTHGASRATDVIITFKHNRDALWLHGFCHSGAPHNTLSMQRSRCCQQVCKGARHIYTATVVGLAGRYAGNTSQLVECCFEQDDVIESELADDKVKGIHGPTVERRITLQQPLQLQNITKTGSAIGQPVSASAAVSSTGSNPRPASLDALACLAFTSNYTPPIPRTSTPSTHNTSAIHSSAVTAQLSNNTTVQLSNVTAADSHTFALSVQRTNNTTAQLSNITAADSHTSALSVQRRNNTTVQLPSASAADSRSSAASAAASVQPVNSATDEQLRCSAAAAKRKTASQGDAVKQREVTEAATGAASFTVRKAHVLAKAPTQSDDPCVSVSLSVPSLPTDGQTATQQVANQWNLDRIDQQYVPLDGQYRFGLGGQPLTGEGVTVYSLDSGVMLNHDEFKSVDGSYSRARSGFDFVENDGDATDCDGHGTHVASTAVGRAVGVAKAAKLVAVRILDCQGSGTVSNTVAALDWVARNAVRPAVLVLSLGIPIGSWSRILESSVRSLVVNSGLTVVVASGNSIGDACGVAPANINETITVAGSDLSDKFTDGRSSSAQDTMYQWSNTGSCVDLFAPGTDIYAACGGTGLCSNPTTSSFAWLSGTSMAVPHVAGAAALYLQSNPQATPSQVKSALLNAATDGRIDSSKFRSGTPNKLLCTQKLLEEAAGTPSIAAASGPAG